MMVVAIPKRSLILKRRYSLPCEFYDVSATKVRWFICAIEKIRFSARKFQFSVAKFEFSSKKIQLSAKTFHFSAEKFQFSAEKL